jgi:hypothetical protein
MKEFCAWKDKEVKKLFDCIERVKRNGGVLLDGFREFAKRTNRKTNSVRNYYYLEIENLKRDLKRAERLGINIGLHSVQRPDKFSSGQTETLVTEILRLKCLGYSVRKACLKLADNSAERMLRYQNKFRSVLKKNKELYNKCLENLKKSGLLNQKNEKIIKNEDKNKGNVVYMKKQDEKKLTDEDIKNLFLGLVRLVKRNAVENIEKGLISEAEFANNILRDNLVKVANLEKQISVKNLEIEKEKEINKNITEENFKLKTKIADLFNGKIVKAYKNKSLAKYLRDIKEKGIEIKTKI